MKKLIKWWKSLPNTIQNCEIKQREQSKWVAVKYERAVYIEAKEKNWAIKLIYPIFYLIDNWFTKDSLTSEYHRQVNVTTLTESEPMTREEAEKYGEQNFQNFYLKSV